MGARQANQFIRLAKVEFPKFNGEDFFDDPMVALKNAKYDKSAKDYQDIFDNLLCRVEVSEEQAISLYLGGLPTELEMASLLPVPATNTNWKPKPNTHPRKQLTQKEYEEKRSKNLCFYCDQKYVLGHKCTGQLYSLIVLADTEEEEEFLDVVETLADSTQE
ncbi:hypothetical protein Tco_0475983 [Tanacetum coccineum]